MANTSRFSWFRKLVTPSRISLQMDDSLPIRSLSTTKDIKTSRKTPKLPGKPPQIKTQSLKIRILTKPINVSKNPVVLDKTKKNSLPLYCIKRCRNRQEGKSHGSQEKAPIRQNISKKSKQEQASCSHDRRLGLRELATRSIEKMVRESQTKLMNQRVSVVIGEKKKKNTSNDVREKSQKDVTIAQCMDKSKVAKLVKLVINRNKDVRLARLQTKLVLKRIPCSSSSSTDDHTSSSDPVHTYQFQIESAPVKKPKKHTVKTKKTKTITKKPKVVSSPAVSQLLKEEQKRLDILRSEWEQLKEMENAVKQRKKTQFKEAEIQTDPETGSPPDLDLKSLIVDPKSFLTEVHVKSKILPADLNDISLGNVIVENPDVFSENSKDGNVGNEGEPN